MKTINAIKTLILSLLFALCFTACSSDEPTPTTPMEEEDPTIELAQDGALGSYITDQEGATLYYFSKDVNGDSECIGGCLSNWPAFYKADLKAGSGLNQSGIGVITRSDGSKQNTYKGWPMYYFASDDNAGDIKGEGVGGNWFVAKKDYTFMIAEQVIDGASEKYLVDDRGNTLYTFTADEPNVSNCNDGCLTSWPPFSAAEVVAPSTVDVDKIQVITGNNGGDQNVFDGKPLYYFNQDNNRGDVNGQGAGGSWFILLEEEISK